MKENEKEYDYVFSTDSIPEAELTGVQKLEIEFIDSYIQSTKDNISVEKWLPIELQKQLPECSTPEIEEISADIINSLKITEDMKKSQQEAISIGRSKESWLAEKLTEAASHVAADEGANYLRDLDKTLEKVNEDNYRTIMTKAGNINQNPHLDGLLAEQHHADTFNMNSAAKGGKNRAEVLRSTEKNSADVVIKDPNGNIIAKYQMKYGETAQKTIEMIKKGNYEGQVLVVPSDQVDAVKKAFPNNTVTDKIGDGKTSSNPLSKEQAKEQQKQIQSGNFLDKDWSGYSTKDIALGIGKQATAAGLQGAAIGAGMHIASKLLNGEEIEGEEVVKDALTSGADFGVKTAIAGALKTASEKEILTVIPKGTPAGTFVNIAFVAVENAKVFAKVATGEMNVPEGLNAAAETTGACVAGLAASAKGAALGASIGAVLGPIGSAVGGLVGSTVGYMAGSKIGKAIVNGAKKIGEAVIETVKEVGRTFKEVGRTVVDALSNAWESFGGTIKNFFLA